MALKKLGIINEAVAKEEIFRKSRRLSSILFGFKDEMKDFKF